MRHHRHRLPKGKTDWEALEKQSDEDVERQASSDSDAQPLTEEDVKTLKRSPRVRIIRMALGFTQGEFSRAFCIPLSTLRDWEQGRREPDQAAKAFLRVIEAIPQEVQAALASKSRSATGGT